MAAVEVVVEEAAVGAVGLEAAEVAAVAAVVAAGMSETIAEGLAMKMKIFRKMRRLTPKNSRTEMRIRTEKRSLWTMLPLTRLEARA